MILYARTVRSTAHLSEIGKDAAACWGSVEGLPHPEPQQVLRFPGPEAAWRRLQTWGPT